MQLDPVSVGSTVDMPHVVANDVQRPSMHHSQEPTCNCSTAHLVGRRAAPDRHEGFLDRFLGAAVVATDRSCEPIGPAVVALIELFERTSAPQRDLLDQLALIRGSESRRLGVSLGAHMPPCPARGSGGESRKNNSHATPGVVWLALRNAVTRR